MAQSIYLGGGVTLLPGFPERLEAEVNQLTPAHLIPKVSARGTFCLSNHLHAGNKYIFTVFKDMLIIYLINLIYLFN